MKRSSVSSSHSRRWDGKAARAIVPGRGTERGGWCKWMETVHRFAYRLAEQEQCVVAESPFYLITYPAWAQEAQRKATETLMAKKSAGAESDAPTAHAPNAPRARPHAPPERSAGPRGPGPGSDLRASWPRPTDRGLPVGDGKGVRVGAEAAG